VLQADEEAGEVSACLFVLPATYTQQIKLYWIQLFQASGTIPFRQLSARNQE
jgi:hypothetical protein